MSEIDVEKQLTKQTTILESLENKRLSAKDWVQELVSQVYALNQICLQQQQQIDELLKRKALRPVDFQIKDNLESVIKKREIYGQGHQ